MEVSQISLSAGSSSVSCNDGTIAQQITDAFSAGTELGVSCNGRSWHTGNCGDSSIISAAQVGYQSEACRCGSFQYVMIRPCIGNQNWGGTGSNICSSVTTTLSITVYVNPTSRPTLLPTSVPTETPTTQPTLMPTSSPSETPTTQPTLIPTSFPTETPTTLPTLIPSHLPTQTPSDQPTSFIIRYQDHIDSIITDFDIVDKNGDEYLNYDEIVFAIVDTGKDGKLSFDEYEAARAEGHLIDTSYSHSNSSTLNSTDI